MNIVEFITAREREDCLASPDPEILQEEWEPVWRKSFSWAVQDLSVALRSVFFALGDTVPFTRPAVRQHAEQWANHPDYREEWRP